MHERLVYGLFTPFSAVLIPASYVSVKAGLSRGILKLAKQRGPGGLSAPGRGLCGAPACRSPPHSLSVLRPSSLSLS